MLPTAKRLHPRQLSRHSSAEDEAVLVAATELQPYAAAASECRARWQEVAERVIAETGDDEISGAYCKRRFAALLAIASGLSDEEWSAEEGLAMLKAAFEKHRQWEAGKRPSVRDGAVERKTKRVTFDDGTPADSTSRATTGRAQVASPVNNPLRGAEAQPSDRRKLLNRVTASRDREKKRAKVLKDTTRTNSTTSVVLSSLSAEPIEIDDPDHPCPQKEAVPSPVEEMLEAPFSREFDSTSSLQSVDELHDDKLLPIAAQEEMEESDTLRVVPPPSTPLVTGLRQAEEPEKAVPPRRSFISNVFEKLWLKRAPELPAAGRVEESEEVEEPPPRLVDVAVDRDEAGARRMLTLEQTVASLSRALSAATAELKEVKHDVAALATVVGRLQANVDIRRDVERGQRHAALYAEIQAQVRLSELRERLVREAEDATRQLRQGMQRVETTARGNRR